MASFVYVVNKHPDIQRFVQNDFLYLFRLIAILRKPWAIANWQSAPLPYCCSVVLGFDGIGVLAPRPVRDDLFEEVTHFMRGIRFEKVSLYDPAVRLFHSGGIVYCRKKNQGNAFVLKFLILIDVLLKFQSVHAWQVHIHKNYKRLHRSLLQIIQGFSGVPEIDGLVLIAKFIECIFIKCHVVFIILHNDDRAGNCHNLIRC